MRVIGGILLGLVLFFPGVTVLQWVGEDLLGYGPMTVTDGCLAMIIILLSVAIVTRTRLAGSARHSSRPPQEASGDGESRRPYSRSPSPEPSSARRSPRTRQSR